MNGTKPKVAIYCRLSQEDRKKKHNIELVVDRLIIKEGIRNKVSYIDCLINEVQGSINSAFVDGDITEEQCDYLFKKYVYGGIV